MLGDIVNGRERSAVVSIEDTVAQSGLQLLHCFVRSLSKRCDEVHLICFEPPAEDIIPSDRLQIHNGFSDTFGWLSAAESLSVNSDLSRVVEEHSHVSANQKVAVVIDSLTPLRIKHGTVKTCQILHSLTKVKLKGGEVVQTLFLLHSDLHDDHSLTLIRHVTSSILKISPSQSANHFALCNVLHKKLSGKVIKINEHFNVSSSLEVEHVEEWKPSFAMVTDGDENQPDPTANLTFNLSLTDQEKQARSRLVLPYTQAIEKPGPAPSPTSGAGEGGQIFYQPDEADDFDEEDPDDDLDI